MEMTIDYAGTGSSQHFLNLTRFLGSLQYGVCVFRQLYFGTRIM